MQPYKSHPKPYFSISCTPKVQRLWLIAVNMIKLGTYLTIAFIVWNLCVSQGYSWDGELSRSPRNVPENKFLIAMLPLLDHIAQQCKSNVSDVVTETQTMVVTIKDQLTGLQSKLEIQKVSI